MSRQEYDYATDEKLVYLHFADCCEVFGYQSWSKALPHGLLVIQSPLLLCHVLRLAGDGEAVGDVGDHQLPSLNCQCQSICFHTLDQIHNLCRKHFGKIGHVFTDRIFQNLWMFHEGDESVLNRDQNISLLDTTNTCRTAQTQHLSIIVLLNIINCFNFPLLLFTDQTQGLTLALHYPVSKSEPALEICLHQSLSASAPTLPMMSWISVWRSVSVRCSNVSSKKFPALTFITHCLNK